MEALQSFIQSNSFLNYSTLVLGTLFVTSIAFRVLRFIWMYFIRGGKNLSQYGSWSMVTGASDGIGVGFAHGLASKGQNIILVARSEDKLNSLAEELKSKYSVKTSVIVADLSGWEDDKFDVIMSKVGDKDVGILINNAGVGYAHPAYIHELEPERASTILSVNCYAAAALTRLMVPRLIEKGKGVIVNVSSGSGALAEGLQTIYASTKSFIDTFSIATDKEVSPKGVRVQTFVPLLVATKLSKIRKSSLTVPSPIAFGRSAVNFIGFENYVLPYWSHAAQWAILYSTLPSWISTKILMSMQHSNRKRALKKKAAKKSE